MKIIIPSKGRAETITTHQLFKDYDYYIVVHTKEDYDQYIQNKTIGPKRIIISNAPYGLIHQRQWSLDNLVEDGEWFISADDDIRKITGVSEEYYNYAKLNPSLPNIRNIYNTEIPVTRFMDIVKEMTELADKNNIKYCGFAVVDNYYYRTTKYRFVGFVGGILTLKKKCDIRYDPMVKFAEDYEYTAENLLYYGKVLINNYVYPVSKMYVKGGCGSKSSRLDRKIPDCHYFMQKYQGLFRYKIKKGCHPKSEIQIRFNNTKQVEEWRRKLLLTKTGVKL